MTQASHFSPAQRTAHPATEMRTPHAFAALFTGARKWKQAMCPSTGDWKNENLGKI